MRVAESTSGKTWQQKWVTLAADGTLTVADKRNSKRRGRQMYDIRRDCMYIWTAAQVCLLNGSLQLLGRLARLFAYLLMYSLGQSDTDFFLVNSAIVG